MNFDHRPILVFWETTKACLLKCKHCRAEAIPEPLPGELSTQEGKELMDQVRGFGQPYPVLILTGGDPLMRDDIEELLNYASNLGLRLGIAPAVTERLNDDALAMLTEYGVRYISISLDGMKETHEAIRGIEGHFDTTIKVLRELVGGNWILQVNTLVSRETVSDLPRVAALLKDLGVRIWELFFLIKVGRGMEINDLTPKEYEDVVHFLYEVSRYGFEVRTVEAPFFRRAFLMRKDEVVDGDYVEEVARRYGLGSLYKRLTRELMEMLGPPEKEAEQRSSYTRDGYGIIFVAYNGDIYPSGFAPYRLGNVRIESLVNVYRENEVLKKIRRADFRGRCGICEYRHVCGGSRARALAILGDILGEDPACVYMPGTAD